MTRTTLLLLLASLAWALIRTASAGEQSVDGRSFSLPDGFTIERVAGPPLVDRPITADFDEQGRLYVADSSGSNDKVADQLAKKPHRVVRLEDTDGDGHFDRRTVFADQLMFPEGTLWFDGSLYVAAPPSIWKLTDTDGDGVADRRVEWFNGKTLTGCANDLHGPYLGPDGWIYWCKGAFAQQTYERPGKPPFVTRASHLFRARPDGTGIEPVMTGGMDNPVDVVFTPGGERIVSCTFLQHPGGGLRDGLIHAVYGGVYGKVHDVLDGQIRTSPDVMPVLAHLGPAAPCGLTAYESTVFGDDYRDNLFACQFNLRKVSRHVLTSVGATYKSHDTDFLVSPDHDFHPTDVLEDADGSLIVLDTGGWYKLCCPTSQLPKPDVLGAIYRVRKTGAAKVDDPRGLKLAWSTLTPDGLTGLLDDPRPAVWRRAIFALGKMGEKAIGAIASAFKTGKSPETRRNAVWAATRIDHPDARVAARVALGDPDETVCEAACHSAGVWRDRDALTALLGVLSGRSAAPTRRAAVEAIGRVGDSTAVNALLDAAARPVDPVLRHSLTYALIEIDDPKSLARRPSNPAALVALDRLGSALLTPARVIPALKADDPATRATASWIAGRHPEWAGALVGFFKARLADANGHHVDEDELASLMAWFAREKPVEELLAETLADFSADRRKEELAGNVPEPKLPVRITELPAITDPLVTPRVVMKAMAQSGRKEVPQAWVDALTEVLVDNQPGVMDRSINNDAVSTIEVLPITREQARALTPKLLKYASAGPPGPHLGPVQPDLSAYSAVPGGLAVVPQNLFASLRRILLTTESAHARSTVVAILSRATLDTGQLLALADDVRSVGPLEVDRLLSAFEQSRDDAVGQKLVAALKTSPARAALRADRLKPLFDRFGERVRHEAEALYAVPNPDAAAQKARLEELLPMLDGGDVRRGQAVFNNAKAACLTCHAVGYVGGTVGPDLTRIGQTRTERDLLEAILYPSLSFVRSYEPLTIATRDGKVISGILRKDSADEVVLAVSATEEVHVPRNDIETIRPGTVSVMPAGLDQQLTRQELADLIAFLKSRQ